MRVFMRRSRVWGGLFFGISRSRLTLVLHASYLRAYAKEIFKNHMDDSVVEEIYARTRRRFGLGVGFIHEDQVCVYIYI